MQVNFEGQRFKEVMPLSKISPKRQVVIPEDICEVIGAEIGDYIEFVRRDSEIVIKAKKLVDAVPSAWDRPAQLPPAPSYEERMRMIKDLEGNAEDDAYDIPIEEIKASRTRKEPKAPLEG